MENAIPPTDATSAATEPSGSDEVDWTGQILGEFRILHRLGRGGMGQVYLAEQTSLKRKVALKLLNPELALNARSLNRFKSEAENVARATHANIVQIYTIGQANGINYIALEYVEGKNLREFIERKGTPEIALGLHIMMQVAAALQRASELGIIHRDIKPENILLTKKGEVKVADFGLSRCFAETSDQVSLTQSQVTMGTPLYMAPEQVERKPVDPRTDIYSFGVTCYHMFAGTPPFRGTSPIEVAYQHVHKEAQALAEVRPDLPADLCAIVQKMMAKKPEERYQSAGEVVRDVNRICESLNLGTIAAVSISSSFIGGAATHTWPEVQAGSARAWHIYGLAAVVIALVGGIAIGWYQSQRDHAHKNGNGQVHVPDGKAGISSKPNEEALKMLVARYLEPETTLQLTTGLEHSMVLGRFYIEERRLEEADQFFGNLQKNKRLAYGYLGRIGHAVTLAFKDDYKASNAEFLVIAQHVEKNETRLGEKKLLKKDEKYKDELEAHRIVWKDTHEMRELVARALQRNHVNAPEEFPEKLEPYRHPPRPTLRPLAAPMPMIPD